MSNLNPRSIGPPGAATIRGTDDGQFVGRARRWRRIRVAPASQSRKRCAADRVCTSQTSLGDDGHTSSERRRWRRQRGMMTLATAPGARCGDAGDGDAETTGDPHWWRRLRARAAASWPPPLNDAELAALVRRSIASIRKASAGTAWYVLEREARRAAASDRQRRLHGPTRRSGSAEIGYRCCLHTSGEGYGTELVGGTRRLGIRSPRVQARHGRDLSGLRRVRADAREERLQDGRTRDPAGRRRYELRTARVRSGPDVIDRSRGRAAELHHGTERADGGDRDGDLVAVLQGELVGRHDAGAGQQHAALGKLVVAEEAVDQLVAAALQRSRASCRPANTGVAAAPDLELDLRLGRERADVPAGCRAERAARRRRPSPAAGTAGSRLRCRASSCRCRSCSRRSCRVRLTHQRQLRLGHVPARVASGCGPAAPGRRRGAASP